MPGEQVNERLPRGAGVFSRHHVGVGFGQCRKPVVREGGLREAGRLPALVVDVGDEAEVLGFGGGQPLAQSVVGFQKVGDFRLLAVAGGGVDVEHTTVDGLLRLKLLGELLLVGTAYVGGALVYEE